jgi:hypothetical protein
MGASLSVAADHHYRAVPGGRRHHYAGARLGRAHEDHARSTDRGRKCRRRQREHRHDASGARRARWLHVEFRQLGEPCRQRRDDSAAIRLAERSGAGGLPGQFAALGGGEDTPRDLKEFIAWLKANPDKATAATVGVGSGSHMCGIYIQNATDTKFQFVPYRGGAPAMQDLVAGQVDFMCDFAGNSLPWCATARSSPMS